MRARSLPITVLLSALLATPALAGFAGTDVFLPMAGRQAGVHPSNWYTTVWVHNPGGEGVTARVHFLPRNTANPSPPWVDVAVAAGDTEKLENVVEEYFHLAGFGALRVTCAARLVVTSRVYSKAVGEGEADSVGQDFAGVPASFAIGLGEKAQILGTYQTLPSTDSEFRYNFGFVETTGHAATVRVTAYDDNGAYLDDVELQVREWSQRQAAFKDWFTEISTENARLEVEVISGSGRVIAYGSGIANGSQDPTTFEMSYADSLLGIPGVQHDATLTGDGTGVAPLGVAPSATVGQVLATVAGGSPAAGEGMAARAGNAVAWQSPGALPLGLAAGGVTFGDATGALAQDPANLFWSSAGKRLGIGTASPRDRLEVAGNIRLSPTSATAGRVIIGDYTFLHGYGSSDNAFVGPSAGNFAETGNANTGVGYASLTNLTAGSRNTAVGSTSLNRATEGGDNTAVGAGALYANTTGTLNTAVGSNALAANVAGHSNTAIGYSSLRSATAASNNSAFGKWSLQADTTGSYNTAVGASSLYSNTEANDNSAFGANTLEKTSTGGRNTAVGAWALQQNTTGAFNTAVGWRALRASTTSGSNTAVGSDALQANTEGHENTAVGAQSMTLNTTGFNNVAVGAAALTNNTVGEGNTALGLSSMYSNLSGSKNTAVGFVSLYSNQTGFENTAVGDAALYTAKTASGNTAVGHNALYRTTTGGQNTAVGTWALQDNTEGVNNVALGSQALADNTTGTHNTAVGYTALMRNLGAHANTAVGHAALSSTNAPHNTAVGDNALAVVEVGPANTAVGSAAGQFTLGSGNVFIGYQAGMNEIGSNRLYIANSSTKTLVYGQFDTKLVGIDTTSPSNTLDVNGSVRVRGLATGGVAPLAVDANGVLIIEPLSPSDVRLKRDIVPLGDSVDVLAALAGLRGVSYAWDTANERVRGYGGRREVGLLAQDVEAVLPEVVSTGADGYKSVDYARLTALLVEVAKAQQREIDALRAEVAALHR